MTFQGQSLLSCVWGVTHSTAAPEPAAAPVEIRQRSARRSPARLRMLNQVMRKLRPAGSGGEAGPASPR